MLTNLSFFSGRTVGGGRTLIKETEQCKNQEHLRNELKKIPGLVLSPNFFEKYCTQDNGTCLSCKSKEKSILCAGCCSFICSSCVSCFEKSSREILKFKIEKKDEQISFCCSLRCFLPETLRLKGFLTCVVLTSAGSIVKFLYSSKKDKLPFAYPILNPLKKSDLDDDAHLAAEAPIPCTDEQENSRIEGEIIEDLVDHKLKPNFTKTLKKIHKNVSTLSQEALNEILSAVQGPSKDGHYSVSRSVYQVHVRSILNSINSTCIYGSYGCPFSVRTGVLKPRIYCRNKTCSLNAELIISSETGSVDVRFYDRSDPKSESDTITISHERVVKPQKDRIRKNEREIIKKRMIGKSSNQYYLEKKSLLSDEQLRAGKDSIGKRTVQSIMQDSRLDDVLDNDVYAALVKMSKSGMYIQYYKIAPTVRLFCYLKKNMQQIASLANNYTLGIDGTAGLITHQLHGQNLELYRIVCKNPAENDPPICLFEGYLSSQIIEELEMLLEEFKSEVTKFSPEFQPIRIISDCSFPIIIGSCLVFNGESLFAYLLRLYQIATGLLTMTPGKTLISVCKFHYNQAIKRYIIKLFKDDKITSRLYNSLCLALSAARTWSNFMELMKSFLILSYSESYTIEVLRAKDHVLSCLRCVNEVNASFDFDNIEREEVIDLDDTPIEPRHRSALVKSRFYIDVLKMKSEHNFCKGGNKDVNPFFFPRFFDYYHLHWASMPLFSSIFLDPFQLMLSSNPKKFSGVRSNMYLDDTNNVSELGNKLMKDNLGNKKMRLDKVIKKQEIYNTALFKLFRQKMLISYDTVLKKSKKRVKCPSEAPEVWVEKKKMRTDKKKEIKDVFIDPTEEELSNTSSHMFTYPNSCNCCSTMAAISLFSNTYVFNSMLCSWQDQSANFDSFDDALCQLLFEIFSAHQVGEKLTISERVEGEIHRLFLSHYGNPAEFGEQQEITPVILELIKTKLELSEKRFCNTCEISETNQVLLPFITVPAQPRLDLSEGISSYLSPRLCEALCSSCNNKKMEHLSVNSFPVNLVVQIGRKQQLVGGFLYPDTVNISINLNLKIANFESEEVSYVLHGALCFNGSDNRGHFYTVSPIRGKAKYLVASGSSLYVVNQNSKKFKTICEEVCFLVYEKEGCRDAHLEAKLKSDIQFFKLLSTKRADIDKKQLVQKNFFSELCARSLRHGLFKSFFEILFTSDFCYDASLYVHVESVLNCPDCRYPGTCSNYSRVQIIHFHPIKLCLYRSDSSLHEELNAELDQKFKADGCQHDCEISAQVTYMPEVVTVFLSLGCTQIIVERLNELLKNLCKIDSSYSQSCYYIEKLYSPESKSFYKYVNDKFVNEKTRKVVSQNKLRQFLKETNVIFLKRKIFYSSSIFGVLESCDGYDNFEDDCHVYKLYTKLASFPLILRNPECDFVKVASHELSSSQLNDVLDADSRVSSDVLDCFFLKAASRLGLRDFDYLSPNELHGCSNYGVNTSPDLLVESVYPGERHELHVSFKSTLVGVLLEDKRHWVVFFYSWSRKFLLLYDSYGPMSMRTKRKITSYISVLSYRRNCTLDCLTIIDLGKLPHSPKQDKVDGVSCGIYVCIVSLKLLLGHDLVMNESLECYRLFITKLIKS